MTQSCVWTFFDLTFILRWSSSLLNGSLPSVISLSSGLSSSCGSPPPSAASRASLSLRILSNLSRLSALCFSYNLSHKTMIIFEISIIIIHAYMHTCIHAYMHTCINAYMHTCIHRCIHTYIHKVSMVQRVGHGSFKQQTFPADCSGVRKGNQSQMLLCRTNMQVDTL